MKRWFLLASCFLWITSTYLACGPGGSSEPASEAKAEVATEKAKEKNNKEAPKDSGAKEEAPDEKSPDKPLVVKACDSYCANVLANCKGSTQVYPNKKACMDACKNMPEGKVTNETGNTAFCRAYYSGSPAKSAPKKSCPYAGISSSDGICGSVCDAYCDQVTANCKGKYAQHKSRTVCMKWCKGKKVGKWNDVAGDTIACRAYHASFPAAGSPKTHCPHAGVSGGGVCAKEEKPCDKYCSNLEANCKGLNSVYANKKACMVVCKNMPPGKKSDQSGNTAFCRAYHSGAPAKASPKTHCPHAGISSSGGVCGGACDAYCDQVTANCTGANAQHKSRSVCMSWCKSQKAGKWNDVGGNTIACRAYHASFPAKASPKTHCPHAGPSGGGVCVDKASGACIKYCDNLAANCTGSASVYADKKTCMTVCKNMPVGKTSDQSGNTAYCRAYHSGTPAKVSPKTHCPHAGISSSDNVCGGACDAYCDQVTANCTGANAQHKSRSVCMSWCKSQKAGKWNDVGGNTIACRAYHASFPAAGSPKTHCPHAGPSGGGVCVDKASGACVKYCDNLAANCKGSDSVYADKKTCMTVCRNMPVGKTSDQSGNTAYCRAYHSGTPAKVSPKTHCPHAGISSSGNVCGSACDAYCDQVMLNCTGANAQHKSRTACVGWCKGQKTGKWNDVGGNTIACRAYHASFPAAANPKTHCPHAGSSGGGVCVDKASGACVKYCDNLATNCTGSTSVYADKKTCMTVCKNMPVGKKTDTSGNTAFCRAYHSGAPAKTSPKTHCPHAGISSSGGVCGSACDAYCDQVMANCTGANSQHASRTVCMSWCKLKKTGKWNDVGGDTIACRAYHASFPAAGSPSTHCSHAGISGGGVCVDKMPAFKCKGNYASCTTYKDLTASGASRQVSFGGAAGFAYTPKCIKIKVGQSITFKGGFSGHPLKASCEEATAIGLKNSGTSHSVKFAKAGYYNYYCTFHGTASGSGMAGNVWVIP